MSAPIHNNPADFTLRDTLRQILRLLSGHAGAPGARHLCLDLGDGAQLPPEEVLETHFQRLARVRLAAHASPKATGRLDNSQSVELRPRTVPIQVSDTLITAITVLAPSLAPLTELAEDVACAVPPVQPGHEFRATLHQALEQTHRQHSAQRVLGTRGPGTPAYSETHNASRQTLFWIVALLAVAAILGRLFWKSTAKPDATKHAHSADE